jgi:hypothetical protein
MGSFSLPLARRRRLVFLPWVVLFLVELKMEFLPLLRPDKQPWCRCGAVAAAEGELLLPLTGRSCCR